MIVVTAAEMRALDEATIRRLGVPGVVLMESAGRAVVEVIAALGPVAARQVTVVAGPGNNGGDGYVVARHLHNRGARVSLVRVAAEDRIAGDARVHYDALVRTGVRVIPGHDDARSLPSAREAIAGAGVIVDALLGTGTARPVEGHYAALIAAMNEAPGVRVAVDLPSGLDADRGHPLGTCVHAEHTVTFGFAKAGLVTAPGFTFVGRLHVADIGIPPSLVTRPDRLRVLDDGCLAPLRAPRQATAHKGSYGHALLVAGSRRHPGAALLASQAAARAGAGLVTLCAPDEVATALAPSVREVSLAPLGPESDLDAAALAAASEAALFAALDGKRSVAFGPGVPRSPAMRRLLERLLARWEGPLVLDADGLNLLAEDLAPLDATRAAVVLTPHPAEMARLGRTDTATVQSDRIAAARDFAASHNAVVVLKGARTVIAAPDGRTAINPTGNPGMASGGTGDVLTGILAALLAQGLGPFEAATAGAYVHGLAGDRARDALGERLLASDLIDALPGAIAGHPIGDPRPIRDNP